MIRLFILSLILTGCAVLPKIKLDLLKDLRPLEVIIPLEPVKKCLVGRLIFKKDGSTFFTETVEPPEEVCKQAEIIGITKQSFESDFQWNIDYLYARWKNL